MKAIAVVDGEHHPSVVRDALDRLAAEHDLAGVLFAGGGEKLSTGVLDDPCRHYGRDLRLPGEDPARALGDLARERSAEAVFDLSGDPVLDGEGRGALASVALALGLFYNAPGLALTPVPEQDLQSGVAIVAVIGTGKRTGKTALAGHWATLLRERQLDPVVVSMGRGGPPEPHVIRADEQPDLDRLIEIARAGGHAASDYLEDAAIAGVATVGCRRCGEGPAGETFASNVVEGARIAVSLEPGIVLLEGSGAALPPVRADRTVCVAAPEIGAASALDLLPVRLIRSQLVAILGADRLEPAARTALERRIARWCDGSVIACSLEPEPVTEVRAGARVAAFTTAGAEHEQALRERLGSEGAEICVLSTNLARRERLERDLEAAERERCDVFLTELKAAAIEVVAQRGLQLGAEIVFLRNRPVSLVGEPDLDAALLQLAGEASAQASARVPA